MIFILIIYFISHDDAQKLFKKEKIIEFNKNYNSVSIIGCQSSGKSTLLNRLFQTKFNEMNESEGNKQTTQGIWFSISENLNTIVIDCEGTDSKERGENRHHFEHCSSLFALALSDVLIMNMWNQDVVRYTASNYGVLKMVFQMNLKLFQQECAKKILIVLRDYDEKRYKKEIFEKQILKDIDTLWADIKKPEQYQNSTPANFFEFEFIALPHKIYREEEFDAEVGLLRERFNPEHQKYLFSHTTQGKNVPIDGYLHYCGQIWDTVIHEKDLNIPGEKEMLAIFRCGEIKQEALNLVKNKVHDLNEQAKTKQISNFSERVNQIYSEAIGIFDKSAKNYLDKIYLDVKKGLSITLINELYYAFSSQISRLIPISTKMFTKELELEIQKSKFIFKNILFYIQIAIFMRL